MPPKQPLSRERVLAAALSIVDLEGLDALTMRRLGQALGVEAMSLYRHIAGRGALLDGLHETILEELGEPPRSKRWTDAVRAYAGAYRRVLVGHPNALVLFATRPAVTPASLRHFDRGLHVLRSAGFEIDDAVSAFQTVVTFVVGHVLSTHAVVPSDEQTSPAYEAIGADLPSVAEAASILADHDVDAEFEFGLDVVVLGLEARLAKGRRPG